MASHDVRPLIGVHSLAAARAQLGTLAACLTPAEQAEAGRFLQPADRERFILGRGTLRRMVADLLGCVPTDIAIIRDGHGKPQLREAGLLQMNVSHSGDLVAVALGTQPMLGIDVEQHRPGCATLATARYFMTMAEHAAFTAAAIPARDAFFFRQWCCKEAVVKGLGTGLLKDPKRFEILFGTGVPSVHYVGEAPDDVGSGWHVETLPVPAGYSAAVVWRKVLPRNEP